MKQFIIFFTLIVISISYIAYTYYKKSVACDENSIKQDADYKMKIAKIEGIVKDANSTIDRKESDLKKLGLSLKDATDMLTKNEEDCKMKIAKIEAIVKDANSTIDKKESDLKKLGLSLKDARDMIAKKDEELKNIQAILGDTNTTLTKKDIELKKLGLSLVEATDIIAKKNDELKKIQGNLNECNSTVDKKDALLKKVNEIYPLFQKVEGKYLYEWKGGDNGTVIVVAKSNNSYEISKADGSNFIYPGNAPILNLTVDSKSLSCSISQFGDIIGPAVIKNGIVDTMGTKDYYMFFKRIYS